MRPGGIAPGRMDRFSSSLRGSFRAIHFSSRRDQVAHAFEVAVSPRAAARGGAAGILLAIRTGVSGEYAAR